MIERFLRYSLEHGRKIALMVSDEKGIRRINVTVTRITPEEIGYATGRQAREKSMPVSCILSAAYARGDDGDTLKNETLRTGPAEKK